MVGYPPKPPQIRTSVIDAYGSSGNGFAMLLNGKSACFAIRCCFVYTFSDSIASFVSPISGPISRHHPSLVRLSSDQIRRVLRYYDDAKTPFAHPTPFRFLHGTVPSDTSLVRISFRVLRCKALEKPGCFGLPLGHP